MTIMRFKHAGVLLGVLLGAAALPAWGGATTSSSGGYAKHTPGTDSTYSWTRMDINAARKAGKPIILYIYDHEEKSNTTARFFEKTIFVDPDVKKAFADFNYVMIRKDDKGWPQNILTNAERGAALYILTGDGNAAGAWWRGNQPTAKGVAAVATQAKASNQAAVERMKKDPPKEFKPPEKQEVAAANGPKEVEEKKPEKQVVPGLNNDEEKTGKTTVTKKTDDKKSGALADE